MKNLKWKNIIKLALLIISLVIIIHDLIALIIFMETFTMYGLFTFLAFVFLADIIFTDFENQLEKARN